ncbi:uncharacterized protein LOC121807766 [Salvia splendens]|uniref:uncharacterized protein LOC121807766 n=1 Tax=Salvia splendens TaxID=180675 RepID=UPI001C264A19|nr:uncharacterized protein LOC121807766 [Salvia splendens]
MGEVSEERRYWTARRELEKVSSEALRYLETTIDRSQWTMAHDEFRRWGETSTNMAECYNNVLLAARELPIRAIVDITFWRTINWFVNRTTLAKQCQTPLTPWAWELFQKNDQRGRRHHVRTTSIARGIYDVLTYHRGPGRGHNIHVVDYREKICSCGKWQTWRMPCSHAVAVLRERSDDIFSHVDTRYHTSVWIHQYAAVFRPLRHQDYWYEPEWTLECSPARLLPRSRGRYNRRRIQNQMDEREEDAPRAPPRCRICGETGHNRRKCTLGRVV